VTADTEVLERLDLMIAVLQLAHHDAIVAAADEIRKDEVNAAILDACADDWTLAMTVITKVRNEVKVSTRSVQRHLAALVARRAIQRRGATTTTAYRASSLI
jgi:hypothetical protein